MVRELFLKFLSEKYLSRVEPFSAVLGQLNHSVVLLVFHLLFAMEPIIRIGQVLLIYVFIDFDSLQEQFCISSIKNGSVVLFVCGVGLWFVFHDLLDHLLSNFILSIESVDFPGELLVFLVPSTLQLG